ncbi:MAG: glycosyltransferase family 39 protein, partial [Deltaproteobacteria bacterium]|nr:glycosyltransferase family 39 protein [Deltaproteobacteria bacterium]
REKKVAVLSAVFYALLPISLILGTAITTDSPLVFFFTAATVFVRKAIIEEKNRFWYFAAIACGGMLMTKFLAVLFFPGVFIFLLLNPIYRRQLFSKEPYLAVSISLLLFAPFLHWNMTHDWLTFQFNLYQRQKSQGYDLIRTAKYIAGQMLAASPVVFVLLLVALVALLIRLTRKPGAGIVESGYRPSMQLLLSITAFPFVFFLPISFFADVGAHYTASLYPVASILIVIWMLSGGEAISTLIRRKAKWLFGVSVVSSGLVSLGIFLLIIFPKMLPDRMLYTSAVNEDAPIASHYFGWQAGGQRISEIKKEWEQRPEGLFMTSKDYGLASMLGFYTPGHPQFYLMNVDKNVVHGKSFLMWEKGQKKLGANTIYVSDTPFSYRPRLTDFFERIQHLPPLIIKDDDGRILRIFYFAVGLKYLGGEPDNLSLW